MRRMRDLHNGCTYNVMVVRKPGKTWLFTVLLDGSRDNEQHIRQPSYAVVSDVAFPA